MYLGQTKIKRLQCYIETHIGQKITLSELARIAGYSQWHFSRLFTEALGKSPFEYLRERRLTEAALRLRGGKGNIVDVALDFAFDSHEGFTRAFTKEFGITPRRYKYGDEALTLLFFSEIHGAYRTISLKQKGGISTMMEKTRTIFVQVIERTERKCLLKRGKCARHYVEYCEEVNDGEVWTTLCGIKDALYEPSGMWFPEALRPTGTSEYVHAVEVPLDYAGIIPDGFEIITLPPCTMMVFQGEPYENDEDYADAVGEVWRHIDTFNPKLYGYEWSPLTAPRFQLAPMAWRGYIEARPVSRL